VATLNRPLPRRALTAATALTVGVLQTAVLLVGAGVQPAAAAEGGSFSALTYNVAGLPEPLSGSEPAVNTTQIGERVNAYDVVNVQEDFNYHADLYSTDRHPYRTPTSGGVPFGSGLNTMSDYPVTDLERVTWSRCNGTDCLTPKGFTLKRLRLAEGAYLDLYNVHANAGSADADLAARRANITQLAGFIAARSAGNAVVVMGDTNTRYTRAGDNIRELGAPLGLTDAWVQLVRGGTPPAIGSPAISCDDTNINAACEVVDKVLYRGSRLISLTATSYTNENAAFRRADGAMLSDHYPIQVRFSWAPAGTLRASDQFGGSGGTPFTDVDRVGSAPASVTIRSGSRVDQVSLTLADGTVLGHGGTGGTARTLTLGAGEYLTSATLSAGSRNGGTRIFGVTLRTNLGRTLTGGTATSNTVTYTAPSGYRIAGLAGRAGSEVDALALVYAPR
jgi:endonuclease/exonuclease/phosphatase family metal-dependent hydrolase